MSFAMCCRRSASRLASSVCGGRSISTVVNRPSPLRPFVCRGFLYSTAATDDDWISSEKAVLSVIDSESNTPVRQSKDAVESFLMCIWKNRSLGRRTPPASFPFKLEDIPGSRSITLSREYNGEHIKVVVSMPPPQDDGGGPSNDDDDAPSNESNDDAPSNKSIDHDEDDAPTNESDDEDDAPSNESNDEGDASSDESDDEDSMYTYPLVVNVTKKSGRSLEFRCRVSVVKFTIDDIHVNLPVNSSEDPKVIRDLDDIVGIEHENLKETFTEYLEIRGLDESTCFTINSYMLDKMKHEYWLWLDSVKEFLEE